MSPVGREGIEVEEGNFQAFKPSRLCKSRGQDSLSYQSHENERHMPETHEGFEALEGLRTLSRKL